MSTVALSSLKGRWVMVGTIMASSMAFIDATALNVALPALQSDFHATSSELFWILNAYLLMLSSLILIGGSLGDKIGRKRIFMLGILIFIIGSAACGFSQNVLSLIIFRMIQGIGGSLMIPGSLALISSSINEVERGKAIGTWSAVTTVVSVGGPILGGGLADIGLWKYIFFINVPIGVFTLIVLATNVNEVKSDKMDKSIDFVGAITVVSGLAALTFSFLSMPAKGIYSWQVSLALIIGIILLIGFVRIEQRAKHPMMPMSIFKNGTFSGVNLLTLFLYAGLGGGMLFLSLNLVQAQGYSQFESGLTILPFSILMILLSRYIGKLSDKYGARMFLILGPIITGTGFMMLASIKQTYGSGEYFNTFFPGIFVFGLGMAITVVPLTKTVMSSVGDQLSGTASGINNATAQMSNVFAYAIFGALAVFFFSSGMESRLANSKLPSDARKLIVSEAINLGNAQVPATVQESDRAQIAAFYKESFIDSYKNVMQISGMLCIAGAFMTIIFIKKKSVRDAPEGSKSIFNKDYDKIRY
ncbi:MFS transporter [Chryseobacterium sp. T20]|uniref:MFS transporter n=1 Tax=Chryseobacterium sp. T20 TaxID=3395375 RepID=UPI0039BD759C